MVLSPSDVFGELFAQMCEVCPHKERCHGPDDDPFPNYEMMVICIQHQIFVYPPDPRMVKEMR